MPHHVIMIGVSSVPEKLAIMILPIHAADGPLLCPEINGSAPEFIGNPQQHHLGSFSPNVMAQVLFLNGCHPDYPGHIVPC